MTVFAIFQTSPRVCLKTGEMLDFWPEMRDFKEKPQERLPSFEDF